MKLLAAWSFPASSSNLAAAIQPGACFGFVEMTDFKSSLAFLMSEISASDEILMDFKSVRYLRIHHRLPRHRIRQLVQLQAEHGAAALADGVEIGQRAVVNLLGAHPLLVQRPLQQRVRRGRKLREVLLLLYRVIADVGYRVPLLVETPPSLRFKSRIAR